MRTLILLEHGAEHLLILVIIQMGRGRIFEIPKPMWRVFDGVIDNRYLIVLWYLPRKPIARVAECVDSGCPMCLSTELTPGFQVMSNQILLARFFQIGKLEKPDLVRHKIRVGSLAEEIVQILFPFRNSRFRGIAWKVERREHEIAAQTVRDDDEFRLYVLTGAGLRGFDISIPNDFSNTSNKKVA